METKKVAFCTLGCKVNQYDSQAMLELFLSQGYKSVPFEQQADVYVINTCTVTATADKKSRQMVARAKRQNPNAIVIAAGCLSQNDPKAFAEAGIDAVVGMNDRQRILEIIEKQNETGITGLRDKKQYDELHISAGGEKTRGFVKIQEGCNNYCSYCIIPYVRGPALSRDFQNILDEAKRLADTGIKEIVLTGIHIDSYGTDKTDGRTLTDVIEAVDHIEGLRRIRLGSLEPGRFSQEDLKRLAGLQKLCPHFHVSLQSGSDTVLKRMHRRYTVKDYADYTDSLRRFFDEPAITTDIIAGFVQETEEEHQQTLDFVRKMDFARVHVFAYSRREGTAASRMKGEITKAVKQARTNARQAAHRPPPPNPVMDNASFSPMLSLMLSLIFRDGFCRHTAIDMLKNIYPYVEPSDRAMIDKLFGMQEFAQGYRPQFNTSPYGGKALSKQERELSLLRILRQYASQDTVRLFNRLENTMMMQSNMSRLMNRMGNLRNMSVSSPMDLLNAMESFMPQNERSRFGNIANMMNMFRNMNMNNMRPEDLFHMMGSGMMGGGRPF